MRQMGGTVWFSVWSKELKLRNRMREFRTYGSVGGASGNRCFYPEVDFVQSPGNIFSKPLEIKLIYYRVEYGKMAFNIDLS